MKTKETALTKSRELRKRQTKAEAILWLNIRNRRLGGHRFVRQHCAGPYIVDFYCPGSHFAVELDGPKHGTKEERSYDVNRDAYLKELGILVLRFKNIEIEQSLSSVLERIRLSCKQERSS